MVWACSQSANGGGFYTITIREEVCSLLLLLLNTHSLCFHGWVCGKERPTHFQC